jgi:hypothetical protein
MGLSPCAEAIRKKRLGGSNCFGNKTGCGYAKNAAQKKSAGRNACSATGLFPVVLVAAKVHSPFSDRSEKEASLWWPLHCSGKAGALSAGRHP